MSCGRLRSPAIDHTEDIDSPVCISRKLRPEIRMSGKTDPIAFEARWDLVSNGETIATEPIEQYKIQEVF
jgi:hypothetical protein